MDSFKIEGNLDLACAIFLNNKALRRPTWVVVTPEGSKIGGFSAELVSFDGEATVVKIANGAEEVHRNELVSFRLASSVDQIGGWVR